MAALGFIGLGNMGAAVLKGFCASPASKTVSLYGYDASAEKKPLLERYGGRFLSSEVEVAEKCEYVFLAVKPQQAGEVLRKAAPALTARSVVISICSGITAEFIRARTRGDLKVVRVMPNTPMMLGLGASAVSSDGLVSPKELGFALSIIESCGIAEIIPSGKMNEIICVNGSSPAFIYLFAKCFIDYAVECGIDEKAALNLFSQTLAGAAKMLSCSGMGVGELIAQVTSKGGTTAAGLEKLRSGGFAETVRAACEACTSRAYELGEQV
ncbi:MAG: pyrroline-5-carboxylate reductase [Oscillospiraceae bacterium]|jgi:pyrroline-5-carboxylate reductase|nr:pyrroline-5-carboxylate reductase [Oscillospiraceae bacterium]